MKTRKIFKRGHTSLAISLPNWMTEEMKLVAGDKMTVEKKGKKIIIEKVKDE